MNSWLTQALLGLFHPIKFFPRDARGRFEVLVIAGFTMLALWLLGHR